MKVAVVGDSGIVQGEGTIKGSYKGKDMSGRYRWTDTYVKRDGVWQCVSSFSSKIG
jgi:ketosteroid isomerase-like protein